MEALGKYAISLGVTVVILSAIAMMNAQLRTQIESSGNNSYAYNTTTYGFQGISVFSTWIPLLALVLVIGLVIAYLLGAFRSGGVG